MDYKASLIILIAGSGSRMNSDLTKQMMNLSGEKIFLRTLERFINRDFLSDILLVCREDEIDYIKNCIKEKFPGEEIGTVIGGETRQHSVLNGLESLPRDTNVVIIHDGARPFVSERMISETEKFCKRLLIKNDENLKGGIFAVPVKDTIKNFKNGALENVPRDSLYMAQTPQIFCYESILRAYQNSINSGFKATDDSMIIEENGGLVIPIIGEYFNIKITSQDDIIMGEAIANKYFRSRI